MPSPLPPLLRKAGSVLAALAMFSVVGGHWAVLQTVAWTQMLADYARASGSVVTAVEETFDGEHPCELCQRIAAAKKMEERGPEQQAPASAPKIAKAEQKAKALLPESWLSRPARLMGERPWFAAVPARGVLRTERPPVPPPRGAA